MLYGFFDKRNDIISAFSCVLYKKIKWLKESENNYQNYCGEYEKMVEWKIREIERYWIYKNG